MSDHLHHDDHPATLELLAVLVGHRADAADLGYQPSGHGTWIDWDTLTGTGKLSTTQRAVARVAHSLAIIERHGGGLPANLASAVQQAAATVVPVRDGRR